MNQLRKAIETRKDDLITKILSLGFLNISNSLLNTLTLSELEDLHQQLTNPLPTKNQP